MKADTLPTFEEVYPEYIATNGSSVSPQDAWTACRDLALTIMQDEADAAATLGGIIRVQQADIERLRDGPHVNSILADCSDCLTWGRHFRGDKAELLNRINAALADNSPSEAT